MKKFVLLFCGMPQPTPATGDEWRSWFAGLGDALVDGGNPLGAGRWVTRDGASDLAESTPAQGYCLVLAESLDAAEVIAASCPDVAGVRVYEALSM